MDEKHRLSGEVKAALAQWAADAGARLLVLFGSSAAGDDAAFRGDVDLAVWFPELPTPERRLAMVGELQDRVEPRRADVVFLRPETDPVLRFEIFRTGEPLHEARTDLFVDEVVRALGLYEDALPFRRALERKVVEGSAGS